MSFTEATFENLIRTWMAATLAPELPDAAVIWDRQKVRVPNAPFATLRLVGPSGPGLLAEERDVYNPAAPAGQEIEEQTIHHHEYALRVQTYALSPSDARTLILKVHDRAYRRSGRAAFRNGDPSIVVAYVGPVQDIGALVETDWQGRAALDLTLRVADIDSEMTTYIEKAPIGGGLS